MRVVAGADEHFGLGLAALGSSVIRHRPAGLSLEFYAIDAGLTESTRTKLTDSWRGDDVTVHWIRLDAGTLARANVSAPGRQAATIPLLLDHLLPADIGRVLFLDADTLVLADLRPLWEADLAGQPLAAVQDTMIHFIQSDSFVPDHIDRSQRSPCFNSGVLLIDLERWRRDGLFTRARELRRTWAHRMWSTDQQPLNWALCNRWTRVPLAWNRMTHILDIPSHRCTPFDADEFDDAVRHPRIAHFAGTSKPWRARCRDDQSAAFAAEIQRTSWAGWAPPRAGFAETLADAAWREPHRRYQFIRRGLRTARKEDLPRWPWYRSAAGVALSRPWSLATFAITRALTRRARPSPPRD
jgi:lipopolysaccharide biosynthesis glycosyltransferase